MSVWSTSTTGLDTVLATLGSSYGEKTQSIQQLNRISLKQSSYHSHNLIQQEKAQNIGVHKPFCPSQFAKVRLNKKKKNLS